MLRYLRAVAHCILLVAHRETRERAAFASMRLLRKELSTICGSGLATRVTDLCDFAGQRGLGFAVDQCSEARSHREAFMILANPARHSRRGTGQRHSRNHEAQVIRRAAPAFCPP